MKQTFEIRATLPSLNEIIDSSKTHWSKYASPKKGYTEIVAAFARQQLKPVENYPVDIEIHWFCKDKKKDKDNISAGKKFIMDGLVKSGILLSDGWMHVGDFTDKFSVDRRNPKIVVTIKENSNGKET